MRGHQQNGLVIFKRHRSPDCPVHKMRIPADGKRFYFECACPFWIYGRTPRGDVVPRQTLETSVLAEAEALRASYVAKYSDSTPSAGPTIQECCERYLASRRNELGERTFGYYEAFFKRLRDYCTARGATHMKHLNVDLLEDFKTDGLPSGNEDTTKSKAVEKLRAWLREAHRRGWISEVLHERVRAYKATYEQKEPYSDAEVDLILAGALKLSGGTQGLPSTPRRSGYCWS